MIHENILVPSIVSNIMQEGKNNFEEKKNEAPKLALGSVSGNIIDAQLDQGKKDCDILQLPTNYAMLEQPLVERISNLPLSQAKNSDYVYIDNACNEEELCNASLIYMP